MSYLANKTKFVTIATSVLLLSSLISCETRQQSGTVMGAGTGALLGSQFGKGSGKILGAGIGALLGGFAGNQIGKSLDDRDRVRMSESTQRALERNKTGQTSTWQNPDSGNSGTITTTRTSQREGRYCREYTQTLTVGGKTEKGYGTACRQPDGSWEIVN
jgi:surface antigen